MFVLFIKPSWRMGDEDDDSRCHLDPGWADSWYGDPLDDGMRSQSDPFTQRDWPILSVPK